MAKKSDYRKAGENNLKKKSETKKSVQSRKLRGVKENNGPLDQSDRQAESEAWYSLFTDFDIHLFREGRHIRLYEKFGSHEGEREGIKGTYFAVWAPNAEAVSVIGNFNRWNMQDNMLGARWDSSGIWEGFIPRVGHGEVYKYAIKTKSGNVIEKGDPFARYWEEAPHTASIIWNTAYKWEDTKWMEKRQRDAGQSQPMSVYEVHPGSWRRNTDEGNRSLTYAEMANDLVAYVKEMGYTHVEFMPIMEHPFYGSWGYQITGFFAATSRYGEPQGLMHMIDKFHQEGIGVILDWVPSHFPGDAYGLYEFDGTHLYEHADPRLGFHPDWKSYIFNYGRLEVRSFLISNAIFWLDKYHADGLRVDAVASMLYLDYSRKEGEWLPNVHGGNENIDAIAFLKAFNENVYKEFPDVVTIAEESTSWSLVSRPTYLGGLGFGQKWMMGWMHDTLEYFKKDPIHRKYHQNEITFSIMYAFTENFMLPLSHDEVVHGKGSLIGKMPGDEWQRFANLRLMFGFMYVHPGTKLMFMGGELGQYAEWNHEKSLDWHLLKYDLHRGLHDWVKDLNSFYRSSTALYELQFDNRGFEWIDYSDGENSIIVFMRKGNAPDDVIVVVCNFTPTPRHNYRIGVPFKGLCRELINSNDSKYGGSGLINQGMLTTEPEKIHGRDNAVVLNLPPLGITILKMTEEQE